MIRKDIGNLIKLKDGEKILGILESPRETKIRKKYLNKEYHNLEALPASIFYVDDDMITFTLTHVFTNLRYIAIGVNFWQIYEHDCLKLVRNGSIQIENYLLFIEKNNLKTVEVKYFLFVKMGCTIILGSQIEIQCKNKKTYVTARNILVEKWGYAKELFPGRIK